MIVLLSNSDDPHTFAVSEALRFKEVDYLRLYVDKIAENRLTVNLSNQSTSATYNIKNIDRLTILNRRALYYLKRLCMYSESNSMVYFGTEMPAVVFGILESVNSVWINHPSKNTQASRKLVQLDFARQKKFPFPKTIVTNDPTELKVFSKDISHFVFKTLATHQDYDKKITYTSCVKVEEIKDKDLLVCPAMFQEKINKKLDIRVTVIGDKIFGAACMSKNNVHIDWRYYYDDVKWEAWTPSKKLITFVREMMKFFDLKFGAFDFVEDINGVIFFLELNPNGQWLWIQIDTGQDIASAIADQLICYDTYR